MATLQTSSLSFSFKRRVISASVHSCKLQRNKLSMMSSHNQHPTNEIMDEFSRNPRFDQCYSRKMKTTKLNVPVEVPTKKNVPVEELHAISEAVADRAEMHKNLGVQRNNWNHLLLSSVNGMTATAALMAAIAASGVGAPQPAALKLSSSLLYVAATGILMLMNKIQPSQLAEEQRNAARLCNQLQRQIQSHISLRKPTTSDVVKNAMEKVLALDKAYPLPLLGVMLNKFPKKVEPAVWWPNPEPITEEKQNHDRIKVGENGWTQNLEEEMREVARVVRRKDITEYLRLGRVALKVNKILAFCGPLLTGLAAIGSAFLGNPRFETWAVVLGVTFGALATVVNTLEHGGQVGMVFELYRDSAGFFKLIEQSIESTLKETDFDRRENGEVFEAKVALELGRSLSELRNLAMTSSSSRNLDAEEEFASKLF